MTNIYNILVFQYIREVLEIRYWQVLGGTNNIAILVEVKISDIAIG